MYPMALSGGQMAPCHQDPTQGRFGHGGRCAAEDESAERSTLMRSEDDEVDALRICRGEDRLRRVALPDEEGGLDALGSRAGDECPCPGFDARPFLVDPTQEPATRKAEQTGIDHAEHQEDRARLDGQGDCLGGGVLRCGGQVRREQHATEGDGWFHATIIGAARDRDQ